MNFHKYINYCDFSIHVRDLELFNNFLEKFDRDPKVNCVTILGDISDSEYAFYNFKKKIEAIINILEEKNQVKILQLPYNAIGSRGAKCLADGLTYTSITRLSLYNSDIESTGMKCLADILKDTCITHLHLGNNNIGDDGIKYLASGLKNSNVISLHVGDNGIKSHTIKYLADVLKDTNIISFDLSNLRGDWNEIADEGLKYLSENLKHSYIRYLNLDSNGISNVGVEYLAEHLKDTCVKSLSLQGNKIDKFGIQYLVKTLQDTQIVDLCDLEYDIDCLNKIIVRKIMCQNKIKASKIKIDTFQKLIKPNGQTYDLEFVIPNGTKDLDMAEYFDMIKIIHENPNFKGIILDLMNENRFINNPNIIKKVNEFITTLPNKFNTFINNNLPILLELFNNYDYVKFVKLFEDMKSHEAVQNLLFHRVLYYEDEDAEILNPFIYKMLDKYNITLFNEKLEPNKREKIISFYQNHREIDGAQEIVDLLRFKSLKSYNE